MALVFEIDLGIVNRIRNTMIKNGLGNKSAKFVESSMFVHPAWIYEVSKDFLPVIGEIIITVVGEVWLRSKVVVSLQLCAKPASSLNTGRLFELRQGTINYMSILRPLDKARIGSVLQR